MIIISFVILYLPFQTNLLKLKENEFKQQNT